MGKLYVVILMLVCVHATAHAQERAFMRIYDLAGNKFQKGYFAGITDSSLFIYKKNRTIEITAANIGYIKTKRSVIRSVLTGTLVGMVPISVLGISSAKPYRYHNDMPDTAIENTSKYTPAQALDAKSIANIPAGTLPAAFTRRSTFVINGNRNNWRIQKNTIALQLAIK
jgi:hypothetical protein